MKLTNYFGIGRNEGENPEDRRSVSLQELYALLKKATTVKEALGNVTREDAINGAKEAQQNGELNGFGIGTQSVSERERINRDFDIYCKCGEIYADNSSSIEDIEKAIDDLKMAINDMEALHRSFVPPREDPPS